MNELQRRAYLEAMGIDQYFPRFQLPSALPSPLCELPTQPLETVPEPVAAAAPVPVPVTATGSQQAQAALGAVIDLAGKREQPAMPKRSVPVDAASAAEMPRFALTIAKTEAGILLIDDGLTEEQDYADYLRLLQNILVAVGAGIQAIQLDPFIWPMVQSVHVDQSALAAQQTLAVYVDKLLGQSATKHIVVMGELAGQYLPETHSSIRHNTVSARSALQDASIKPHLWQQLQSLKQALVVGACSH